MASFFVAKSGGTDVVINVEQVRAVISYGQTCGVQFGDKHQVGLDCSIYEFVSKALDATVAPKKV